MRSLIIFLLVVSSAFANIVVYNNTNAAGCTDGCSLLDNSIWQGNQAPQYNDTVIIESTTNITIYLNASTIALNALNISGPVTFWLFGGAYFNFTLYNGSSVSPTLNFDGQTTLLIENSTMIGQGTISKAIINNGTLGGLLFSLLTATSVDATNSSIINSMECGIMNLTNSYVASYYLAVDYFYSYGSNQFIYAMPTIYTFGSFNSNPNLVISQLHVNTTIEINDCVSTVYSVFFDGNPTASISFNASNPSFSTSLYNVGGGILNFGNNMQVTLNDGISNLQLNTGDNVALYFVDTSYPYTITSLQTTSTVNITSFGYLYFDFNGTLDAIVNSTRGYIGIGGGYVSDVAAINMIPNSAGVCTIFGNGLRMYTTGSSFHCAGDLNIGYVYTYGTITVNSLTTSNLQVNANTTINGNVVVQNGWGILLDGTLTVNGAYTQTNGSFNCSFTNNAPIPLFLQANTIQMSNVDVYLNLDWSYTQHTGNKALLAQATTVVATFKSAQDLYDIFNTVSVVVENNGIYAIYNNKYNSNPSFFSKYWYFGIVGIAVAFIFAGVFIIQCIRHRQRHVYQPVK